MTRLLFLCRISYCNNVLLIDYCSFKVLSLLFRSYDSFCWSFSLIDLQWWWNTHTTGHSSLLESTHTQRIGEYHELSLLWLNPIRESTPISFFIHSRLSFHLHYSYHLTEVSASEWRNYDRVSLCCSSLWFQFLFLCFSFSLNVHSFTIRNWVCFLLIRDYTYVYIFHVHS